MRLCLIIDAGYLFAMQKKLGSFDILRFRNFIEDKLDGKITRGFYITTLDGQNQQSYHSWLKTVTGPKLEVVIKNTKAKTCDSCGRSVFVEKGVDIAIVTQAIKHAQKDNYDTLVLVNGDADLLDALLYIRDELGKKIVIVGDLDSISTDIQAISDEVISVSDNVEEFAK
ncbi:MAG: NYN domain-containing protein [Fibrobacterota bacterium]